MTDVADLETCSMLRKIEVGEALELLPSEGLATGFQPNLIRNREATP